MGRAPCCDKANVKKGPWSPEEDAKLKDFIEKFGTCGNWISLPQKAGLKRCGKSCRLRWLNYLRPNIKHGEFTDEEDRIICTLYASIGSRWSIIAGQLPGRTDNDIKNYWNTKLKKKLMMGVNNIPSKLFSPLNTQFHQPLSNLYNINYSSSFYSQATKFLNPINENTQNYLFTLPSTHLSYNFQEGTNFLDFQQNNNMLMFGGNNEASCSNSSDGSLINKEIKHEEQIGGFVEEKFMLNYNGDYSLSAFVDQKQENGILGELGYDYEIEEVNKQVFNSGNFLLNDENKKGMNMYYYH